MANKSFKQEIGQLNPAMRFIDVPAPMEQSAEHRQPQNAPPEGYKLNPLYIETKSRRLQILIRPSLYERIKTRADLAKESVNEVINSILDMHI